MQAHAQNSGGEDERVSETNMDAASVQTSEPVYANVYCPPLT